MLTNTNQLRIQKMGLKTKNLIWKNEKTNSDGKWRLKNQEDEGRKGERKERLFYQDPCWEGFFSHRSTRASSYFP